MKLIPLVCHHVVGNALTHSDTKIFMWFNLELESLIVISIDHDCHMIKQYSKLSESLELLKSPHK